MDKLYYIVCEEKGATLFEGRFQGRTRAAAIKFLKEQIGRPGLNGTVFTVTEIPVPLIREIIEAILKGQSLPTATTVASRPALEPKAERFDAYAGQEKPKLVEQPKPTASLAPLTDWKAVKQFYAKCHSPSKTAEEFGLSVNTVKARIRRKGWK